MRVERQKLECNKYAPRRGAGNQALDRFNKEDQPIFYCMSLLISSVWWRAGVRLLYCHRILHVFLLNTLILLRKNHTQAHTEDSPTKQRQVYHPTCTETIGENKNYNQNLGLCASRIYRSSPPSDTAEEEPEAADRENLTDPLDQEKS
jgi:hypothetical protein